VKSGWVAALVCALYAATFAASVLFLALGPARQAPGDVFGGVGGASFLLLSLTFATVGALLFARVPRNRIGWLFCLIGLLTAWVVLSWAYADHGVDGRLAGATFAASFPGEPLAALLAFSLLLFPDGRLPSRRWQPAALMLAVAGVLLLISDLFRPGRLDDPFSSVSNPLGISGLRGALIVANRVGWLLVVVGFALAAASLLVRLRRARGIERQQLEFVLAVGAVVATVVSLDMLTWLIWPQGDLQVRIAVLGVALAAFPAAAGVAILRYRLYEIDFVISRSLVYMVLTVLLAAAYVLTALVVGAAVGRGSAWTTAAATLAVALAFRPLRTRVQDAVDRRFNRARYDALRRIGDFLNRLRAGQAAPEAIEELLQQLVADPRLELHLFLPDSGIYVDVYGSPVIEASSDGRQRLPIERAGARVGMVLHQQANPEQPDLLPRLIEAGGLAIEITRLRVELRRQLAEVEASRARIVAAAYEERRRIERDLHDGAQQRLVSIGLAMRHAQHQLSQLSPDRALPTLDGAVAELSVAIDELRELARGLPPAQLDAGLAPALQELASRASVAVEVRATPARLPRGVEAAAYFIACEGLTNAVKHAHASRVVLTAAQRNGTLVVSVADDGIGGASPGDGSGLSGLSDRVAAQGGTLTVDSDPRTGTTLTAELPCAS
jgi:signal transduction histidine kinase